MAVPRFLFVSGVRGEAGNEPLKLTGVSWRLLGGNNRELGRSAHVFAGLEACHLAALEIRERAAEATVELRAEPSTGRWTWQLRLDTEPVVIAGRSYLRLRECQYNLAQFLAFAPVAGMADAVVGRRPHHRPDPAVLA